MKPQDRTRAILRSNLPTSDRFVLVAIADYCDENGKSWPSAVTLAADTGLNERSVRRAMKRLEGKGLRITKRKGQVSVLHVVVEALPPRPNPGLSRQSPGHCDRSGTPDSDDTTPDNGVTTPDTESQDPGQRVRRRDYEGTNSEATKRRSSSVIAREGMLSARKIRATHHPEVIGVAVSPNWGESPKWMARFSQATEEIQTHLPSKNPVKVLETVTRWAYLGKSSKWARTAGEPLQSILGGEDMSNRLDRYNQAMEWERKGSSGRRQRIGRGGSGGMQDFGDMVPFSAAVSDEEDVPFGDSDPTKQAQERP